VAQYEEGRITRDSSREDLEAEAGLAERKEEHESDPVITLNINGNRYSFPKSKMRYYAHKAAMYIKKWRREQRLSLDEEKYLKFLCAYGEWLEGMS
jgi:hypothetical protein